MHQKEPLKRMHILKITYILIIKYLWTYIFILKYTPYKNNNIYSYILRQYNPDIAL